MINGKVISVSAGGIRTSTMQKETTFQLKMSWSFAQSECKANVDFATYTDANAILALCNKGLQCPHVQGLGLEVRLRAITNPKPTQGNPMYVFNASHKAPFRISVTGLFPYIDEYDIEKEFKKLSQMTNLAPPVRIELKRQLETSNPSQQTITPPAVELDHLTSLRPLKSKLVSSTSFFDQSKKGRAGFYLQYDSEESARLALDEWSRNTNQNMTRYQSCGQPIRLIGEFKRKIILHEDLYKHFERQINTVINEYTKEFGIQTKIISTPAILTKKDQKVVLQMSSTINAPSLTKMTNAISHIIRYDIYNPNSNVEKMILFSQLGRKTLNSLSNNGITFIHWDNKIRVVKIYGNKNDCDNVISQINQILSNLSQSFTRETIIIHKKYRKDIIKGWKEYKDVKVTEKIISFYVNIDHVEIWGTPDSVTKLQQWMTKNKYILNNSDTNKKNTPSKQCVKKECSLCTCEADNPYFYRTCNHGGCHECVENQFSQSEITLPIVCMFDNIPLCLSDIESLSSPMRFNQYKIAAVNKYVREHSNIVQYCPSSACTSILNLQSVKIPKNDAEEKRLGGHVIFCQQCDVNYCLRCSKQYGVHIPSHQGFLCRDVRGDVSHLAKQVSLCIHITTHTYMYIN
jgi:hypothetical protein